MYKEDLAWNNQQWLICHKTKPDETNNQDLRKGKKVTKMLKK